MGGKHPHSVEEINEDAEESVRFVKQAPLGLLVLELAGTLEVAFLHDLFIEFPRPTPT